MFTFTYFTDSIIIYIFIMWYDIKLYYIYDINLCYPTAPDFSDSTQVPEPKRRCPSTCDHRRFHPENVGMICSKWKKKKTSNMSPRDFWMSGWMLHIESFKWVFWSRSNGFYMMVMEIYMIRVKSIRSEAWKIIKLNIALWVGSSLSPWSCKRLVHMS